VSNVISDKEEYSEAGVVSSGEVVVIFRPLVIEIDDTFGVEGLLEVLEKFLAGVTQELLPQHFMI